MKLKKDGSWKNEDRNERVVISIGAGLLVRL